MKDRVLIAMSGGVDSSVAAALLLEQGCTVEGVTMKLTAGVCCDIASAQQVCRQLGIPHRVVDMQPEFERSVVRNFIAEYRMGRTPNPCIRCNAVIKFERLLDYALGEGFDRLATGHYARTDRAAPSERFRLLTGVDRTKDQSYFLYRLTAAQLARVVFPLGALWKRDVKRLARQRTLVAASRPESQEICFVPDNDYRAFLRDHAPDVLRPGKIVMVDGSVAGRHDGIAFYTVGQRRGLGIASGGRLYVVRIEPSRNRVVLGPRGALETDRCMLKDVHFLAFDRLEHSLSVSIRVRYRAVPVPATILPTGNDRVEIVFTRPVAGVTPGQAAVFYDGEQVVGGGIIEG